jgi:small conductance mechanosensitive channel
VRSPDAPLASDDLRSHARTALTEAGCAVAAQ